MEPTRRVEGGTAGWEGAAAMLGLPTSFRCMPQIKTLVCSPSSHCLALPTVEQNIGIHIQFKGTEFCLWSAAGACKKGYWEWVGAYVTVFFSCSLNLSLEVISEAASVRKQTPGSALLWFHQQNHILKQPTGFLHFLSSKNDISSCLQQQNKPFLLHEQGLIHRVGSCYRLPEPVYVKYSLQHYNLLLYNKMQGRKEMSQ